MPVLLSLLLVSYFMAEAASQELDTSVIYPAKVLNGTSEEVCTPSELEMILNQIGQEVSNILQNTDTQCPGQASEHPATSCREVSQCDPHAHTWLLRSEVAQAFPRRCLGDSLYQQATYYIYKYR